jgi:purine-binding chemotaxis protein CheW
MYRVNLKLLIFPGRSEAGFREGNIKGVLNVQQLMDADSLRTGESRDDLYLTFTIDNEVYGIGIACVKEIIGIQPIAVVPGFPEHIKGVINLRGKIIPVMDMRLRFRKAALEYDSRTCIIVVDVSGASIGLIVDRVSEVAAIPESEIAPPPSINHRGLAYLQGLGKANGEITRLLDLQILLSDEAEALKLRGGNAQ